MSSPIKNIELPITAQAITDDCTYSLNETNAPLVNEKDESDKHLALEVTPPPSPFKNRLDKEIATRWESLSDTAKRNECLELDAARHPEDQPSKNLVIIWPPRALQREHELHSGGNQVTRRGDH